MNRRSAFAALLGLPLALRRKLKPAELAPIPRVAKGEWITAKWANELTDRVNELSRRQDGLTETSACVQLPQRETQGS